MISNHICVDWPVCSGQTESIICVFVCLAGQCVWLGLWDPRLDPGLLLLRLHPDSDPRGLPGTQVWGQMATGPRNPGNCGFHPPHPHGCRPGCRLPYRCQSAGGYWRGSVRVCIRKIASYKLCRVLMRTHTLASVWPQTPPPPQKVGYFAHNVYLITSVCTESVIFVFLNREWRFQPCTPCGHFGPRQWRGADCSPSLTLVMLTLIPPCTHTLSYSGNSLMFACVAYTFPKCRWFKKYIFVFFSTKQFNKKNSSLQVLSWVQWLPFPYLLRSASTLTGPGSSISLVRLAEGFP